MTRTYEQAVAEGRRIVTDLSRSKWELGDLALEVAPIGADGVNTGTADVLISFADDIGVAANTLRHHRETASLWPAARRRAAASYSAHRELQRHPDRFSLIADGMTVSEARAAAGQKRRTADPERPASIEQVRQALADPEARKASRTHTYLTYQR